MKYSIILSILIGTITKIFACPTCVGKVTPSTVPFFTSEFNQPGKTAPQNSTEYGLREFKKLLAAQKEKK